MVRIGRSCRVGVTAAVGQHPLVALRRERDPDLDPFRGGIAVLLEEDGTTAGYVATIVEEFWSPFRPLTWQERVWLLITWSDGRRERIEEDYPPWISVSEMRQGRLELERGPGGEPATFRVRWLEGDDREEAWSAHGITEEVGAYL